MIGRRTSPPLPVELPPAEGTGAGATEGTGVAAAVGAALGDALGEVDAGALLTDGAAIPTVKVQVPRSTWPSVATDVH